MKIIKGSTYKDVLRWGSSRKKYVPITAIDNSAPCLITCPGHGIPNGWGFQVESVKGMKELRGLSLVAEVVDADTIIAVNTNSLEFSAYVSGGVIAYNEPVNLAGYSARMHIRESFPGPIVASLTSDDGSIVIDPVNFTISREIGAIVSAGFQFKKGVYDLELYNAEGFVIKLDSGKVDIVDEVTRDI